jgi:hypothetical protein
MSSNLNRRGERLEQHLPGPDRSWRADDYYRWRHQLIADGDPEGLIAQAKAAVRAVALACRHGEHPPASRRFVFHRGGVLH